MVKIIMHGCNGHMGQVISDIVEKDPDAEIVAGIDIADQGKNSYPVFTDIDSMSDRSRCHHRLLFCKSNR